MVKSYSKDRHAEVEQPVICRDPDALAWDDSADLIVIGFGAAGASTAIQARELGADVLVLDRFEGGGASAYSAGVVYGGATRFQRDAGVEDNVEDMIRYIQLEAGDAAAPETVRRYCEQSAVNIDWLAKLGVEFKGAVHPGKIAYPDNDKGLYHSGNELVPAVMEISRPAPRGHRTMGKGWTGYRFFGALREAADRAGVRLRFHNRAVRLILDESGRVIGVETLEVRATDQSDHQKLYDVVQPLKPFNVKRSLNAIGRSRDMEAQQSDRRRFRARQGVVLACGGFAYNPAMLQEHMPPIAKAFSSLMVLGSAGCDGTGIQLGQSAGGVTKKISSMSLGRQFGRPPAALYGLYVNAEGRRFINEDSYAGTIGNALAKQPKDGTAWLVIDSAIYRKLLRQCIPDGSGGFRNFSLPMLLNIFLGGTRKARTLEGLARKCGIDGWNLRAEVSAVNAAVDGGTLDRFGKSREASIRIGKGPYRALNFSLSNPYAFLPFFTISGLWVNEESGLVLKGDGTAIAGLYAAGRSATGLCSNNYVSGLSLADCVFSGRRAAHAALGRQPNEAL